MKLSHITLGLLLMSAAAGKAQVQKNVSKNDSLKNKHKIKPLTKANIQQKDTAVLRSSRETSKRRYCGPCGMG
jgi:hypothetical protein